MRLQGGDGGVSLRMIAAAGKGALVYLHAVMVRLDLV